MDRGESNSKNYQVGVADCHHQKGYNERVVTMKKIITSILILSMLFSSCALVYGAEAESEDITRVLSYVKERIGSTDKYTDFVSSVSENGGFKQYRFRWSDTDSGLNVTATQEGVILSLSEYDNSSKPYIKKKPTINKISQPEAMDKARALLGKINPDIISDLRLYANTYDSLFDEGYSFRIQRVYQAVDVVGDAGFIRVNNDATKIESFNIKYTEGLLFDDLSKIISRGDAIEKYKSELGMVLSYKIKDNKAILQYVPAFYDTYISAVSGEAVKPVMPEAGLYKNEASMDSVTMGSGGGGGSFTEAELKNLETMKNLISRDEAEKIIKDNKLFGISKDMELGYFNITGNAVDEMYNYSMEFIGDEFSAYAYIDAQNGDILTYNRYGKSEYEEHKENITLAKSYVEALASKHYKADETGKYRFEKVNNNTYSFLRYQNNIPCFDNRIHITINNKGDILSYNISYSEVEFDSPEGILSHSEACESMMKECGYGLYYYPSCSKEGMKKADIGCLVYDITKKTSTIDAKSGKPFVEYEEEPIIGAYRDLEGHYAETMIRTLAAYGIGFEGDRFEPDKVICEDEYLALLIGALTYGEGVNLSESFKVASHYYRAGTDGIIKATEKNPDAPVTREKAAIYMVKVLGFDEIASIEGIYIPRFSDVTKNTGYISILNGIGVIKGFDGKFNPDNYITRADAMVMIYNYLSK